MTKERRASKKSLDDAIQKIREDTLDAELVSEASERIWGRVSGQVACEPVKEIRSCGDFQSLIPAYLEGRLAEARVMLLNEHSNECVACGKALRAAKSQDLAPTGFRPRSDRMSFWMRWGSIAAALLVGFGLFQMGVLEKMLPWEAPAVAVLEDLEGKAFRVLEETTSPIGLEQKIASREVVKTAKDSGAVFQLADGSRLEMAERTEVAVLDDWFGTTVQLKRGNVIIEAAEQDLGHLYVSTAECRVAVKGTVFSVSHGMKGSRVSVIEGEVLVEKDGLKTTLTPGDQFASQPNLTRVSVEEDIAWSQNAEQHLDLLKEFAAIQKDLHDATFGQELRYSSQLLNLLPEGTVVYGAIPNVSGQLGDVYQSFLQRVQENAVLREWYEKRFFPGESALKLDEFVEKITGFGEYLGDEVVLALVREAEGVTVPVVMAQVTQEGLLRELVNQEAERLNALSENGSVISVVSDVAEIEPGQKLFILFDRNLVVVSSSPSVVESIQAGQSTFSETKFYQEIVASYAEGVDWLLSLDLESLAAGKLQDSASTRLENLGVNELHSLVVQRKRNQEGISENRATLNYTGGEEGGIISWIANPGPIGGMEFVSPEAYLAAAFVISEPAQLMDGFIQHLRNMDPDALAILENFELEHNIRISDDIAATLGGEVVFALDGPVLPKPAWKVIVEVYDPVALQRTIEHCINELNQIVVSEGRPGFELLVGRSGGTTVYSLVKAGSHVIIEYAYSGGYLVITPDRALIHSARQSQEALYTLVNSPAFLEALPQDASLNLSAVFYQNLAPMLEPILSSPVGDSVTSLSPEVRDSVEELVGGATPILVTLCSEPGQITVASGGSLESFWVNLGTMASLGGPEGIARMLRGDL